MNPMIYGGMPPRPLLFQIAPYAQNSQSMGLAQGSHIPREGRQSERTSKLF